MTASASLSVAENQSNIQGGVGDLKKKVTAIYPSNDSCNILIQFDKYHGH